MMVRVRVLFQQPDDTATAAMKSMAGSLTDNRASVQVAADPTSPGWLVADFTMPAEPQYKAVDRIDAKLRFHVWERLDSTIGFPRSEAEIARAQRKTEKRKEKRTDKRKSE